MTPSRTLRRVYWSTRHTRALAIRVIRGNPPNPADARIWQGAGKAGKGLIPGLAGTRKTGFPSVCLAGTRRRLPTGPLHPPQAPRLGSSAGPSRFIRGGCVA